jgi:hypothetical protein
MKRQVDIRAVLIAAVVIVAAVGLYVAYEVPVWHVGNFSGVARAVVQNNSTEYGEEPGNITGIPNGSMVSITLYNSGNASETGFEVYPGAYSGCSIFCSPVACSGSAGPGLGYCNWVANGEPYHLAIVYPLPCYLCSPGHQYSYTEVVHFYGQYVWSAPFA